MKPIIYLFVFLSLALFTYGQGADSSVKRDPQEQQLFPGAKADKDFRFNFPGNFSELNIRAKDGRKLSGLLFKSDQPKGLVFYLHGSNGALNTWGKIAQVYTALNYDVFMLDYRGYGRSDGQVTSEAQLYSDVQAAYELMIHDYSQRHIIVIGQALGAAPAAMLAANNSPGAVILQAPWFSVADWMHNRTPNADTSNLKYQFKTNEFLKKTKTRVIIFHGDDDNTIYSGSSEKLSTNFKAGDQLFILSGEGHNDFTNNKEYLEKLTEILK